MRPRSRERVCRNLGFRGFWLSSLILALPMAGATQAQIEPGYSGDLVGRALREPSLHIALHLETVAELPASDREGPARRLESLGVTPDKAFLDRRGGRWATLLTSVPLLPGSGVGNHLSEQDMAGRFPGSVSLEDWAWRGFEEYLRENAGALAIDLEELSTEPRIAVHDGGDLVQIYVGRQIAGVPVRDSYLTAVVNHGNLVLFGAHQWGDVGVATRPRVASAAAQATLSAHLEGLETGGSRQDPELILVPTALGEDPRTVSVGEGYRYRLAWMLKPELPGRLGRWEALVDAHGGELLSFLDTLSYATTRKTVGGVYPISNDGQFPDGIEQPGYPMPYADVTSPAGALFTDAGGNYPVCVDGDVTTTLSGRFIRIEDFCGPLVESSSGDLDLGTGGGIDCAVPVGSDSLGNTHAARTAFFELNRIAAQARGYLPDNEWLQRQLTAVTNIPELGYPEFNCNAFWDETTVNFFTSGSLPSGPDCNNTGELAGVLDHEWGHGLDNNDNIAAISNPGEGIADIYAALRLNDSCIARGFYTGQNYCGDNDPCTSCDGVREIDFAARSSGLPHDLAWIDDENNCAPPVLGDVGPCGGGIHCEGAVYSEAVWDLVHRDLRGEPFDMDLNTALEVGTRLSYLGAGNVGTWYTCANDGLGTGDGCNADGGYLNYLAADDDDGNLDNGTPHMEAIFAAFNRHGIACASPDPLNSGCTDLPATRPVVTAVAYDRSVLLTWVPATPETLYRIFRTEGVFGCDFGKVQVGETTGGEFWDDRLLNGTEYSYTVMAVGGSRSCMGPASSCSAVTPVGGANLGFDPDSVALVGLNGDLDPFVDNCEQIQVVFEVANTGTGPLTDVELVGVEVLSPLTGITLTSPFPQTLATTLDACEAAAGSFSFQAEDLSQGDLLTFRIDVSANGLGGRVVSHILRLADAESSVTRFASKTFSFESDMEGWRVVSGTFDRTGAGGGANGSSFYLTSSANLADQCDAVQSPAVRLSSSSTLEISTQIDIEPSLDIDGTVFWFDRANAGLTRVSTGERTPVSPDGGRLYNASGLYGSCGTQNQDGWADSMTDWDNSTWSSAALGADEVEGEFVHLDLRYGTDAAEQGFGLHIDEVTVTDVELVVGDGQADQCIAGNQPPVAVDDLPIVRQGGAVVLDVLANDSDPDVGDSLTILGVTQPPGGTVVINTVGPDQDTLTYIPDGGPGRLDSFQYSVGDGRGGSAIATVIVDFDVILYDDFETGDDSLWSATVGGSCDPDGLYIPTTPGAVQYSCCTIFGPPQVDVDISDFLFAQDGTQITPSGMHYSATLTGTGATCPSGGFSASDTVSGGCNEIYSLDGIFIDENTWSGSFDMTFIGSDCSCFGADPCVDQSFPVTALRP